MERTTPTGIESLLVEHLALPKADYNLAREDIRQFTKEYLKMDVQFASDEDLSQAAESYMEHPEAFTYFSDDNRLKVHWSKVDGRAEIQRTILKVMSLQQHYILKKLHGRAGDCPGCRKHAPPAPQSLQQPRPLLPEANNAGEDAVSHVGQQTHGLALSDIRQEAISDHDDNPSPPIDDTHSSTTQRKNSSVATTPANCNAESNPRPYTLETAEASSASAMSANIPTRPHLAQPAAATISRNFRGKQWKFRTIEHRADTFEATAERQAEEMNRVLANKIENRSMMLRQTPMPPLMMSLN